MTRPSRTRILVYGISCLLLLAAACNQHLGHKLKLAGYSPREGDMIFQSMPQNDLVVAIEGVTKSKYSHCGIVIKEGGQWSVLEAIGPVKKTSLWNWSRRGRGGNFWSYRLKDEYQKKIPEVINQAKKFMGKPYDVRYRMDDERIYCSELLYKAFKAATGEELGKAERLGDLNWKPFERTIRKYEQGEPPLDRRIITPVGVSKATQLGLVFSSTN
ncbi:MAG: YiiX/YebB-like N1pC/P60 family cysteine hydrolase [Planctomycetota bacterium]|jgi:hypothetical protein|nr:YiiX/YebB-like N1pC/P60 family cysteine hydrolase [Planctomycetota bacterium]MDP7250342.1 YiiX/YebB-like N1pC/P60 family cysteine hydrolase [Planctomycetota bacterium]|tara:strand:+ start:289 stop:933 length:645 start_codon:yes stop_codon:yes gene_type:complete